MFIINLNAHPSFIQTSDYIKLVNYLKTNYFSMCSQKNLLKIKIALIKILFIKSLNFLSLRKHNYITSHLNIILIKFYSCKIITSG